MDEKWIQLKNLYGFLDWEPFVIISSLILLVWGFYRLFLKEISQERHRNIRAHYRRLIHDYFILIGFFFIYILIAQFLTSFPFAEKLRPYVGILSFLWGLIVFVRVGRLFLLQYLFLGSMQAGVPILLVNIFSLAATIVLSLWGISYIFGIQLTPLIATSAVFSLVLGLALQETLGNIFAGISLQIDKSFEIGDWLEVLGPNQKIVGQVKEISWRSTVLVGWSDENITIPNRTMANSQIYNFASGDIPLMRSQVFRIPYGVDVEVVRKTLLTSLSEVPLIRSFPNPICFISETTESWITFKLAYYIDNYGVQFSVGDKVIEKALIALGKKGIQPAGDHLKVSASPGVF